MPANSLDQFVRQFSDLQRRLKSVERASQGSRRSVVGGGVTVFDADGSTVRGVVGLQPDGTTAFTTVNDPIPPMPTAPIIYPIAGGLEITWNGAFWANVAAPSDLAYVEVHASPYAVYTPGSATLRAKLPRGGSTVTVSLPADLYTVVFVAVTTGGSRSTPSVSATETPALALTDTDLAVVESAARRAREVADTAQARADQAVLDAAAASAAAEAAEATSAAVSGTAAAAQTAADQAASDAAAALAQAQAAGTDADAAQTAADTAQAAADAAETAAAEAGTAAAAADAKAAQAAADAAQSLADAAKAQTAADAAKASADAANTAAGNAQGTADEAKTDAASALTAANGKNKVFYLPSTTPPTGTLITNDLWFQTDKGNAPYKRTSDGTWVDASFGDGAIAALNVGKLVTGELSAGVRLIAGLAAGTHVEITSTGLYAYREDLIDGVPDEFIRLGTETNDFFGISNAQGDLVVVMDDTGEVSMRTATISEDPWIMGRKFSEHMSMATGGTVVGYFNDKWGTDIYPVKGEIGVAEAGGYLYNDHVYEIRWKITWAADTVPSEARVRIRSAAPTANGSQTTDTLSASSSSYEEGIWNRPSAFANYWQTDEGSVRIFPAREGRHRFGLTMQTGAGDSPIKMIGSQNVQIVIMDLGLRGPMQGIFTALGGSLWQAPSAPPPAPQPTPAPKQQYIWESRFTGAESFRGDGSRRTDIPSQDVVQGWDPSGYNGDGKGYYFWNNTPSISGTVDRVDIYLYSWTWYYNSGGTAIINMTPWIGGGGSGFPKLAPGGDWRVGGFPRGGGRWLTVPGDWFAFFHNNAGDNRARGITLGPGYGTDGAFYGKFNDARLKIWYTQ